jgi:hypothetical protein
MVIPTTSPVFFVEPKPGDLSAMHSAKASSTPVFRSRLFGDFRNPWWVSHPKNMKGNYIIWQFMVTDCDYVNKNLECLGYFNRMNGD